MIHNLIPVFCDLNQMKVSFLGFWKTYFTSKILICCKGSSRACVKLKDEIVVVESLKFIST